MSRNLSLTTVVAAIIFASGTASAFWFITDMFDQISKKPQEGTPISLPADSIPISGGVFPVDLPRAELVPLLPENPFAGEASQGVDHIGKEMYGIYCNVCHGPTGMGDGSVAATNKGIPPMPLLGAGRLSDQELYAQIWVGSGAIMGPYYWAMTPDEVWHVVNYVRSLAAQ